MAIVKVGTYRNPPEDITDYEAIVAHLNAYTRQIGNQGMILTEWANNTTQPKIAMGSYISHGGVLYVVEDEDYAINFPTYINQEWFITLQTSGETLLVSYTFDGSGFSWNAIYNGLYDSSGKQLLPYRVSAFPTRTIPAWYKYKLLNPAYADFINSVWVDYQGRMSCIYLGVEGNIICNKIYGYKLSPYALLGEYTGAQIYTYIKNTIGGFTGERYSATGHIKGISSSTVIIFHSIVFTTTGGEPSIRFNGCNPSTGSFEYAELTEDSTTTYTIGVTL